MSRILCVRVHFLDRPVLCAYLTEQQVEAGYSAEVPARADEAGGVLMRPTRVEVSWQVVGDVVSRPLPETFS